DVRSEFSDKVCRFTRIFDTHYSKYEDSSGPARAAIKRLESAEQHRLCESVSWAGPDRVLYGSDTPFNHMKMELDKILMLCRSDRTASSRRRRRRRSRRTAPRSRWGSPARGAWPRGRSTGPGGSFW